MATREAGIKVTLNAEQALQVMQALGREGEKTGSKIKSGLQAGFKGVGNEMFKGGGGAIKDMAGGLKTAVGAAATLGGGIGFGMLVKRASDLRAQMRDIEFAVNKTGKATANWKDLMAGVNAAQAETGKGADELGAALDFMFAEGGDIDFAEKALAPIGHAAQASGKSVQQLAGIAVMLQEKFGATTETLPEMLAAVTQATGVGGLALEAMGDKFGLLAGEAADAGFGGAEGMSKVLGMLNALDDRLGEKSIPSFKKLFQTLKDGSSSLKEIQKASGLKLTGLDGAEKLAKIMGSAKGSKAMSEKLGGEQRVVFDLLAKDGIAGFQKIITGLGEGALSFQDIVEHSKSKQQDDPQIKLNKAIDQIAAKFTEPQMLDALDNLSESLPKVANGIIKLLDFATKHPALAGAAFVGLKVGGGMAGAGASQLGSNAAGMLKDAIVSGGKSLAADIKQTFEGGAPAWGKAMGAAVGIAGAAAIAIAIGQALIDARIEEKQRSAKQSMGTEIEAATAVAKGDKEGMLAAKQKLEADLARQKDDYNSFTKSGIDPIMNLMAGAVDSDFKAPELEQMKSTQAELAKVTEALAAFTEKTLAATKGTEELAGGAKKAGQAAQQASQQLSGVSGAPTPDSTGNGTSKGPGGGKQPVPGFAAGT